MAPDLHAACAGVSRPCAERTFAAPRGAKRRHVVAEAIIDSAMVLPDAPVLRLASSDFGRCSCAAQVAAEARRNAHVVGCRRTSEHDPRPRTLSVDSAILSQMQLRADVRASRLVFEMRASSSTALRSRPLFCGSRLGPIRLPDCETTGLGGAVPRLVSAIQVRRGQPVARGAFVAPIGRGILARCVSACQVGDLIEVKGWYCSRP